jgi:signal transduction histidine kinase
VIRSGAAPVVIAATSIVILVGLLAIISAHRARSRRRHSGVELRERLNAAVEVVQSKDELLANVSHQLRTPLTSIFGFARLLEDGVVIDEAERDELVRLISRESDELLRMVDDILTLGRADSGILIYQPRLVSPFQETRSVVEAIERRHGPIDVSCDEARIWVDPLRLRQLTRNLVSNAHKHGGAVIQVNGRAWLGRYRLVVRDNGAGVPEHLLPCLFDRFVPGSDSPLLAGSVGLGLHIAKRLAEGMGGTVEYARRDGWTEFTVFLPLGATVETKELADASRA